MPKIDFNINNYVEFTLTEYGAKILNSRDEWYATNYPDVEVFQNKPYKQEGQIIRMQLWEVISRFGEFAGPGLETFCEDATITLEVKE